MNVCKVCGKSFEHTRGFKLHLKRDHDLSHKEYVIKYDYGGVHPTCACGCGEKVSWRNDSYFMKLIRGHVTPELRDAQSRRRKGKKTSSKTKELQSISSRKFWSSIKGKKRAFIRAENLRKFHSSDKGKVWAKEQSERLKKFNKTSKGKEIRKAVGVHLSRLHTTVQGAELKQKQSSSIKKFYASVEGREFLRKRSEKMKAFYKTEEGRLLIESTIEKNRKKLLLSKEDFDNKLSLAFKELIPISNVPTYENYVGYRKTFEIPFVVECKKKGHRDTRKLINVLNVPKCLACNRTLTKPQLEIADMIREMGFDVVLNERDIIKPKEIDVFVKNKNLAIEFNGLYWHSELNRDSKHVESKRKMLQDKGVKFLTIFEDEWRDKKQIVESMIRSRLGVSQKTIGARKCRVVELSINVRRDFLNKNHLDGDARCSKAFGLMHNDKIVAVISLRKPNHKSIQETLEVARFATKLGYNIPGGLSRLLSHSTLYAKQNGYKKLMSYVDARIGEGKGYKQAGMKLVRETSQPRFWWTDFVQRYDRFTFKATTSQSQNDIAKNAGVSKIFGAKNYVFEIVFS